MKKLIILLLFIPFLALSQSSETDIEDLKNRVQWAQRMSLENQKQIEEMRKQGDSVKVINETLNEAGYLYWQGSKFKNAGYAFAGVAIITPFLQHLSVTSYTNQWNSELQRRYSAGLFTPYKYEPPRTFLYLGAASGTLATILFLVGNGMQNKASVILSPTARNKIKMNATITGGSVSYHF